MDREQLEQLEREIRELFSMPNSYVSSRMMDRLTEDFLNDCSDEIFCLLYVHGHVAKDLEVNNPIKQRMLREEGKDAFAWLYCADLDYMKVGQILSSYNIELTSFRGGSLLPFILPHLDTRAEVLAHLSDESGFENRLTEEERAQFNLPGIGAEAFKRLATEYDAELIGKFPAIKQSREAAELLENKDWLGAASLIGQQEVFHYLSGVITSEEMSVDDQCKLLKNLGDSLGYPVSLPLAQYPWVYDLTPLCARKTSNTFEAESKQQTALKEPTQTSGGVVDEGPHTAKDYVDLWRNASIGELIIGFSEALGRGLYESVWRFCRSCSQAKRCLPHVDLTGFVYNKNNDPGASFKTLYYNELVRVPEFQYWMWLLSFSVTIFVAATIIYLEAFFFWPSVIVSSVVCNEFVEARDIVGIQHHKLGLIFNQGEENGSAPAFKI